MICQILLILKEVNKHTSNADIISIDIDIMNCHVVLELVSINEALIFIIVFPVQYILVQQYP